MFSLWRNADLDCDWYRVRVARHSLLLALATHIILLLSHNMYIVKVRSLVTVNRDLLKS